MGFLLTHDAKFFIAIGSVERAPIQYLQCVKFVEFTDRPLTVLADRDAQHFMASKERVNRRSQSRLIDSPPLKFDIQMGRIASPWCGGLPADPIGRL